MKYVYLALLIAISTIAMFGVVLPYLISEKDTVMVLSGFVLMIAYCLCLIHIAVKVMFPKTFDPSIEEKNHEE